jgi:hypothetical protein
MVMNVRRLVLNVGGLAAAAVLAIAASAQGPPPNPDLYEPVLIPVSVLHVPGAFGTVWSTELWYRNDSDTPVSISPVPIGDFVPQVHQIAFLPVYAPSANAPGIILYLERSGADHVQFDLRLFDTARPGDWGTKLPTPRENDFSTMVDLFNIPTSTAFRDALRVYALPDHAMNGDVVHVAIYSYDEELLASADLSLEGFLPYAQVLSLADAFPAIRKADRVRVQVSPARDGVRIWAFVSTVSNSTQSIALVSPN